jgi:hypothetical protein
MTATMPEDTTQSTPLSERVLGVIETDHLTPKPRWHFLLREWVVWFMAFGAFVVGSIASALSIYIADASRFMEHTIEISRIDVVFEAIPFVWLALLVVAIFYSVHALRETRRGYRFHVSWLVGAAVVASIGMGFILDAQGFGAALDRYLLVEAPFYQPVSGFSPGHWMRPQEGVIAGVVLNVDGDTFTVRSLDGSDVEVRRSTTTVATCPSGEDEIGQGVRVRIMGTSTGEGTYEAYAICEFHGRGGPFPTTGGPSSDVRPHRQVMQAPSGVQVPSR